MIKVVARFLIIILMFPFQMNGQDYPCASKAILGISPLMLEYPDTI